MVVRKAVIPAAGLGTRFLPATKSLPKELLPIVDTPTIQYIVEEAVAAGITDIAIITSRRKPALEDHFSPNEALEALLSASGKPALAAQISAIADLATFTFIEQSEARGLGHAVSLARDHVGDEPFVVLLGDDLLADDGEHLRSIVETHDAQGTAVLSVRQVPGAEIARYGCVDVMRVWDGAMRVRGLVEKPAPVDAPSDLAIFGRYVFTPSIFDALEQTEPGRLGEIQLTDAIASQAVDQPVYARLLRGSSYDVGSRFDMVRANIEFALRRADLAEEMTAYLAAWSSSQPVTAPLAG